MKKFIPAIIAICLLSSCRNSNNNAAILLQKAQAVIESNLDSALIYIDSLAPIAETLNETQHWEYIITTTQAKYKNYEDVTQDTAIFEARNFFQKKDDYKQLTLAHLYSGNVYQERGEYKPAMIAYNDAFEAATLANDTLFMGRAMQCIGSLFYSQNLFNDAIISYKKAAKICDNIPKKKAEYYGCIGRCFALMPQKDSAIYYLKTGIDIATEDNKNIQSQLQQNLSVVYLENHLYDEALQYLRQSIQNDSGNSLQNNLAFGKLFLSINRQDSVSYYINLLKEDLKDINTTSLDSLIVTASIYDFFVANYKQNKQYDSAYFYQQKYTVLSDYIYRQSLQESVYEVQQKYNFEAEQSKHKSQLIERQKIIIYLTITILIAIAIISVFGVRLFRKTKKESDLMRQLIIIQQENTELNELKDKLNGDISGMKQEISELEQENNNLQNTTKINEMKLQISNLKSELESSTKQINDNIMWRTSLLCRVATSDNTLSNTKETQLKHIKQIILGENSSSWESIIELADKTYPKLLKTINKIPELSDTELRICVLTFMGMSAQEIADVLNISPNTVFSSRTIIRKKIKIEKSRESISKTIMEMMNNQ